MAGAGTSDKLFRKRTRPDSTVVLMKIYRPNDSTISDADFYFFSSELVLFLSRKEERERGTERGAILREKAIQG